MPSEDRRIIFNYEEVYKAIYAFAAQRQMPKPPPGRILSVQEAEDNDKKILIDLEAQEKTQSKTLDYSRDFLAAALMIFCKGYGIPLPKNARKSVLIEETQVILRVQI